MSLIHRAARRRALSPATARLLTGFATRLGLVVLVLVVLAATGLPAACDAFLRRQYYGVRGARASEQQVLLVAADEDTIAAWGPPPWQWDRWQALHAAIAAGKPRAIAVVEPRARVAPPSPAPAALASAESAGMLLLPPAAPGATSAGQPALDVSSGAVDAVVLANADGPTVTARLIERAGLTVPGATATLPVSFLGPARQGGGGLPTLPAHRVAAGDIPAAAFAGKIVVIGLTAPSFATRVPTPVGPMAPAQVQAQALLALSDGATWHPVPAALRWLLVLLFAAATLVIVPRFYARGGLVATGGLAALVVLLDYSLFASGAALLGASLPLVAIVVAAAAARVHERVGLHRRLAEIGRWLRQGGKASALRGGGEATGDDEAFWARASELARLYFDCRSSIVAELPPEKWHVRLRVINGVTSDQITERRRDVRRNPYRKAHLTLSPVWHPQFMAQRSGLGTLIVPLVAQARLHGFWLLNFAADAAPDAPRLELVKKLAQELAFALARRSLRAAAPAAPAGAWAHLLGDGRFTGELDELGVLVRAQHQQQQEMTALGEHLPLGVLVATLWGEVRYTNAAMKRLVVEHGVEAGATHSLPELLAGFTGMATSGVHTALARLVREPQELRFHGNEGASAHDFVLTRLGADARATAEPGEQLLLLCALPHTEPGERRDRASTVSQRRQVRSLGSSPPAFHEEEVTVLRAQLPPPPTAPEPLPPPQTSPHPRVEPELPEPPPLAVRAPVPRGGPPPLPPLPQVIARRRVPPNDSASITRQTAALPDDDTRVATPPRRR
jgi:CHASE2 domain-containing sensor protein